MNAATRLSSDGAPHLAAHVRTCVSQGRRVILDLRSNRYFGLSPEHACEFDRWLQGEPRTPPRSSWWTALCERGLISTTHQSTLVDLPDVIPQLLPAAHASADVDEAFDIDAPTLWRFTLAWRWAARAARHHTLLGLACQIMDRRAHAQLSPAANHVIAHANTFRRLRPWAFAAKDQCLLHALALTHYLLRHGHRTHWVAGVSTQPWRAHSWVQSDDYVLDDTPEHIRLYTPIFAL